MKNKKENTETPVAETPVVETEQAEINTPTEKKINAKFSNATRIQFTIAGNPKRPGTMSAQRFEKYMAATTVGEYFSLGAKGADWKYERQNFQRMVEQVDGSLLPVGMLVVEGEQEWSNWENRKK